MVKQGVVPDELTKPFWDAANEGRLTMQNCSATVGSCWFYCSGWLLALHPQQPTPQLMTLKRPDPGARFLLPCPPARLLSPFPMTPPS